MENIYICEATIKLFYHKTRINHSLRASPLFKER